jgi:hypothetical protein
MGQILDLNFWLKVITDPSHLALLLLIGICFYTYNRRWVAPLEEKMMTGLEHESICNKNFKALEELLDRKFEAADLVRKEDIDNLAKSTADTVNAAKEQIDRVDRSVNILIDHALNGKK